MTKTIIKLSRGVRQIGKTFSARIYTKGKPVHLGTYATQELAQAAYTQAAVVHLAKCPKCGTEFMRLYGKNKFCSIQCQRLFYQEARAAAPGLLTQARLKELLHYDPASGIFTWRICRGNQFKPDYVSRRLNDKGYKVIRIDGALYKAHRLAFFYMHGVFPSGQVDHINGIRNDNRFVNLRQVTRELNAQNRRRPNSSKQTRTLGVYPKGFKFQAIISFDGKNKYLGTFSTADAAHAAYVEAKRRLHPGCTI